MQPFLSLDGVSKHFGGVQALREVSLDLRPGEVHCLAGENGSGKSTLIKVISGIHRPDGGRVIVGGEAHGHLAPAQALHLGVQTIYQDFSLFPNLTVAENLALNSLLEHRRKFVNWRSVRRLARQALENLGVTLDLRRLVGELSVAQKQLVAIARALLHDARLIIMDEPTSALTGVEVDALFKIIRRLKESGVAILFVSHKLREMLKVSDRFTILRNGVVVAEGPAADFNESKITLHMTGRSLSGVAPRSPGPGRGDSLLKVQGLSASNVNDVSFELFPGEIVGLTGLLGSGQTELAQTLFGAEPYRSGEIFVRGERRELRSIQDAIEAGIAYVPEDRLTEGLFLDQSVEQNLIAASLGALRNRLGLLVPARVSEQVRHWVEELHIKTGSHHSPAWALSGGNQQRVVLAKWLSTNPALLILNGPTVGVDVGSREEIHERLRELAAGGMGILMISDDLPEIVENCHRILILHQGCIVDELAAEQCDEEALTLRLSTLSRVECEGY